MKAPNPRPKRVLYVVSLYPCWSETFIVREIATLIASGVDVRILSLKAPYEKMVQPDAALLMSRVRHPMAKLPATLARLKAVAAHPLRMSAIIARLTRNLAHDPVELAKSFEALARGFEQLDWVRDFDPDIIHAHFATFPSTVAWALARVLDKPFGFTCHAHDIFVNDQLLKEKIESATVAVTISNFNVRWLTEKSTPRARERMRVVHCGVDLPALPYRAGGREPGLILTVGRFDPIKGFEVLIDALAELKKAGKTFRCKMIGQGPLEAELKARIARHGLTELVELPGVMPQAEVRKALYAASVFVLPSVVTVTGDRDGIPVSLMEAMAAGTPAVSTLVSGIPELIENEQQGLLVPERDAPALAHAMGRLLDDETFGARLAVAARAKVEREFDAAREAGKVLELFADAVA